MEVKKGTVNSTAIFNENAKYREGAAEIPKTPKGAAGPQGLTNKQDALMHVGAPAKGGKGK